MKLYPPLMAAALLSICSLPCFATDATFYNKTAVPVKVIWSSGGNGPSAVITPNGSHTFSHGRWSNIDYKIQIQDEQSNWHDVDKDWVSLYKDRKGNIEKLGEHSVNW